MRRGLFVFVGNGLFWIMIIFIFVRFCGGIGINIVFVVMNKNLGW